MATANPGKRVALVAGSGGRVGSAIVSRLRAEGFAVGGLDEEPGAADLAISVDLTNRAATTTAADRVADELGPVSVLVTVPEMVRAGNGTVVTISSWLALAGIAGESYYAAAAGSILAFTKSVALEVAANGVRVNCI